MFTNYIAFRSSAISLRCNQLPTAVVTQSHPQANEVYPKECIYMQLEASSSEQGEVEEEEEEEDIVSGSPEIRLVPSDSAAGKPSNITGLHNQVSPVLATS